MSRNRSKSKVDCTIYMVKSNVAAIDIGATMHMAAVRADRTPEPLRSFGIFTSDLHRTLWLSMLERRSLRTREGYYRDGLGPDLSLKLSSGMRRRLRRIDADHPRTIGAS